MKLSDDQVSKIRVLLQEGRLTNTTIAQRFGVSAQQIAVIKSGKSRAETKTSQKRSAKG